MTELSTIEIIQWLEIKRKRALEDQDVYVKKGDVRQADKCSTIAVTCTDVINKITSIL